MLWLPRWLTKDKQKFGRKTVFAVEPKCASPLQTEGGAVVCSLGFPGLFAMAKGNVYYSCNLLRAVDFNCFSKCEDNCDIWKRLASCTNKLCCAADLAHNVLSRLLCKILSVSWGVRKERKDLRHVLPSQRSEPDSLPILDLYPQKPKPFFRRSYRKQAAIATELWWY